MPRRARSISASGFMHVIVRGIGKQILFEDSFDYHYYLRKMEKYSLETDVKISTYCLMENHVHFLLRGTPDSVALFMKKLGVSYSYYFNHKYERTGHLFQDRYLSEPVENEKTFLIVYRYILLNPQKAGVCQAYKYPWSSYGYSLNLPEFMENSVVKKYLYNKTVYDQFLADENEDHCLDYEMEKHDDAWALGELKKALGIKSGTELQKYDRETRNKSLAKLRKRGLSTRQIERLTGINRNIVQRVH